MKKRLLENEKLSSVVAPVLAADEMIQDNGVIRAFPAALKLEAFMCNTLGRRLVPPSKQLRVLMVILFNHTLGSFNAA